jgi:predicted PurR-regulated permease PerM
MQGNTTFLIVMAGFLVIQWIEGYLITPLIQQKAVDLPPAHSLAFLMIMGALFGELGVALATPLLAIIRVLGLRLYVEDVLEKNSPEHQ